MTIEDNKRITRAAFQALASDDFDSLRHLFALDAVIHQCGFLQPIPVETLIQRGPGNRSPIVDRQVRLEQMVAEGDAVALRWVTTARYSDAGDPEIDGTVVRFPSMTFLRIREGKITEIWNMRDADTIQSELLQASSASRGPEQRSS